MALQKVVRSTVLNAPIQSVWAILRKFNSHESWHEIVETSRIESQQQDSQVGCIRAFRLKDGNFVREQLIALDDHSYCSSYSIVESTLPISNYVATITLKPITDGDKTFWHWASTFSTPLNREREFVSLIAMSVYEAGFRNLERYLTFGKESRRSSEFSNQSLASSNVTKGRTVRISQYGGPDVLCPMTEDIGPPGRDEVQIHQRSIGINFIDIYLRRGWIPSMFTLPGTLGMEAAGTVICAGNEVTDFLPHDRVAYMSPTPGAYCTIRNVSKDHLVRLPPEITNEEAAAYLLKGITADYLLRDIGRIRAGARWLIHAAAGGVGLLLCAWAKKLGMQVIGTVSSDEKARVAREFGCEHVIVTKTYTFASHVKKIFGDGADVIVDGLGESAFRENFESLAPCGHWISLGQATGLFQSISTELLLSKSATFSRPVAFAYVATQSQMSVRAQRVWTALNDGTINAPPIERHSLESAARAHERLESRNTVGSLILIA